MITAGVIAAWLSPEAKDAAAKAKTEPAMAVKSSREERSQQAWAEEKIDYGGDVKTLRHKKANTCLITSCQSILM